MGDLSKKRESPFHANQKRESPFHAVYKRETRADDGQVIGESTSSVISQKRLCRL